MLHVSNDALLDSGNFVVNVYKRDNSLSLYTFAGVANVVCSTFSRAE